MAYSEATQYLESFINYEKIPLWPYEKSLKLERIQDFLATIDNPQCTLRCIHVAGTKGKGSTCAFVAYILKHAGYKVGLYTSPHLSDFRERIRILKNPKSKGASTKVAEDGRWSGLQNPNQDFEGMISQDELVNLIERIRPAIEKYNKNSKYGSLSFFEVYTSLALVYFKEKEVDFAVMETGLGGKLDATNVVKPLVCVITPISYEHTQKLGNTLTKIAKEKAGIIKIQNPKGPRQKLVRVAGGWVSGTQNLVVIAAPQEKEAIQVIRERCREVGAKLYEVGKQIIYQKIKDGFSVKGIFQEYKNLKIRLLGLHQLINASTAIGAIEALRFYNINMDIDSIRQGLYNTIWPGRCEVISRNPLVVLDGAQNSASSRVLKQTIKEEFKYKRLILVLGVSKDKDISGICRQLCPLTDEMILTQANNPRAARVDFIEQIIRNQKPDYRIPIIKTKGIKEAKACALSISKKEDLILVCGSLFVVGEFRNGKIRP